MSLVIKRFILLHTVIPVQMQETFFFSDTMQCVVGPVITGSVSLLKKMIVKAIQNNYEIHIFIYYYILHMAVPDYYRLWSNNRVHLGRTTKITSEKACR